MKSKPWNISGGAKAVDYMEALSLLHSILPGNYPDIEMSLAVISAGEVKYLFHTPELQNLNL